MTLIEWLQSCTIEQFSEWLIAYQEQCEDNFLEKLEKADISFTMVRIEPWVKQKDMIKSLQTKLGESDGTDDTING